MGRVLVFVMVLLLPQVASARMYMCVDEATGATSFTDRQCDTSGSREEIRVNKLNPGSGTAKKNTPRPKAWRSQTDTRKTGTDFNAQRRALYERKATASSY